MSLGTVYAVLDRLEAAGFVTSRLGEAAPERGGRARRYFVIAQPGLDEVRAPQASFNAMWSGLREMEGGAA